MRVYWAEPPFFSASQGHLRRISILAAYQEEVSN